MTNDIQQIAEAYLYRGEMQKTPREMELETNSNDIREFAALIRDKLRKKFRDFSPSANIDQIVADMLVANMTIQGWTKIR